MKALLIGFAVVLAIAFSPATAGEGMVNCPEEGEWAISVWAGKDGANAEEALSTCGVEIAYALVDGGFTSNIRTLDNLDAVLALGGTGAVVTEPEVIYGRQHSDALPTLADNINHEGALTVEIDHYGAADVLYGPYGPEEVIEMGDGDVLAVFHIGDTHPIPQPLDRFCVYWGGKSLGEGDPDNDGCYDLPPACTDFPRAEMPDDCLHGDGHEYEISIYVGGDGSYGVEFSVERRDVYVPFGAVPFNKDCPISTWFKEMNEKPYCPGYPDATFGEFLCADPEYPGQMCSVRD